MSMQPCVFIVDDNEGLRYGLGLILEAAGFAFQSFESAEQFLENFCSGMFGCLLLDISMPGMSGQELQSELNQRNIHLPIIFLTAYGSVPMAVKSIKAGAVDFLTKPVPRKVLIECIQEVFQREAHASHQNVVEQAFRNDLSCLTPREIEILALAVSGIPNKLIAQQLGISHRTIENHRRQILKKTGANNYLELARLCEAYPLPVRLKPA